MWKSDGTENGTVLLKNYTNTESNDDYYYAPQFTNVNDTVYFVASDPTYGEELWKSDGTKKGTVLVKDIAAGTDSSSLSELTNVNGMLYFAAFDPTSTHRWGLWKSDGTKKGTVLVKDSFKGFDYFSPNQLTNINGTLYFTVDSYGHDHHELWKSDVRKQALF